jgi:hypothetical protein
VFSDSLDIDNPYFPLVVGTKYRYEETSIDDETGETVTEMIVVEVLDETKTILGVVNRVLRDQVFVDGLLVEDTLDWHAQDDAGNVWYFGEDTTDFTYDDAGNLIDTSSATAWEAGVDGAKPGILMEAAPRVGDAYYQEFQRGVALDQGEVLATDESATVPSGTINDVLRTKDTSVLEPDGLEHKFYAPGLGIVQELTFDLQSGELEGSLKLISVERDGEPVTQVVSPNGFTGTNATGDAAGRVELRGKTSIRSDEPVVLSDALAEKRLTIRAAGGATIVDSVLDDLTVRAGDSIGLTGVTVGEPTSLRTDADVFVTDSRFQAPADIRLGDEDNELVIEGSSFASLVADGGDGDDAFDDRGNNEFDDFELRRFEEE